MELGDHFRTNHPVDVGEEGNITNDVSDNKKELGHVAMEDDMDNTINGDTTGAFSRLRLDGLL